MRTLLMLLLFAVFAVPHPGQAASTRRPRRLLAVEFQVQHTYKCTACAEKLAALLREQDGVTNTRALKAEDAALVFFEDGAADLVELKRALARAGFVAKIVWGPAAVQPDGRFEDTPVDTIGRKRPTLKEEREIKKPPEKLQPGYVPPPNETLPVQRD